MFDLEVYSSLDSADEPRWSGNIQKNSKFVNVLPSKLSDDHQIQSKAWRRMVPLSDKILLADRKAW